LVAVGCVVAALFRKNMKQTARAMRPAEWGLLIILSVLWGSAFTFNKIALAELAPFTVLLARVAVGALVLLAILRLNGSRLPHDRRSWLVFGALASINILVPMSLILYGQTRIPSNLASILNSTTPLMTVLLAHYTTADEQLTPRRIVGVLVGFAGVATVIGFDWIAAGAGDLSGQLSVLGASLLYAVAGLLGRRVTTEPLVTAAGQFSATVVMALPIVLIVDQPWRLPLPGAATLAALAAVGIFSTAIAYVIYFRLLATAGAGNSAMVTFLIPITALALGALTGEAIGLQQLLGLGGIAGGLLILDGRIFAAVRARRRI
jgi:drug/metabolite transporter (DMT)-like permease